MLLLNGPVLQKQSLASAHKSQNSKGLYIHITVFLGGRAVLWYPDPASGCPDDVEARQILGESDRLASIAFCRIRSAIPTESSTGAGHGATEKIAPNIPVQFRQPRPRKGK